MPTKRPLTVLMDGRSGAGKTTLADELASLMAEVTGRAPQVVHMDDLYRGWGGMEAGQEILASQVLAREGAGFEPWDWNAGSAGARVPVDASGDLIVEGCGAVCEQAVQAAWIRSGARVCTVWVEAPVQLRKQRALARDPEFAEFWDFWAGQEDKHLATMPETDVVVEVTDTGHGGWDQP
ncbi:MAG TPA: hypothetical protein H9867_07815 [Candidatus Corynebacterium gallistercoris]|uniref:Uncharacterized protein n=1 Tax=Candidatus Corynebacterium gallistercoris TaxID=2838530 RepID=A0A9D1RZA4_9CORY|nr:hypothetical protein [Candidatus Corynebacterium gallistercoris]